MAAETLDFEAPLLSLRKEIEGLGASPQDTGKEQEIARLTERLRKVSQEVYSQLSPWQKVQVARHPQRPYLKDYIRLLFSDFIEIHGDRRFADDPAMVTGMAWFHDRPVMVVGHQKGRDAKQRIFRNFGMPKPEGYRKALRAIRLAAKFRRPILSFIDTPGAYPGMDAEDRGQAEAIAYNIREIAKIDVPIVVTVTGEGGSGGALAVAIGDEILIMENAIYSVISPEGCAAILWKDRARAGDAAQALNLTAQDLLRQGIIDEIVPEPLGGCHRNYKKAGSNSKKALKSNLDELSKLSKKELVEARYKKYRSIGEFLES